MIDANIILHALIERVMKASHICSKLFSVEQKAVMDNQPDLQEYHFAD